MRITLSVTMGILALSFAAPGSAQEFAGKLPANCHALNFRKPAFVGSRYPENISRANVVTKADIVCAADNLTIDTEVFSNGGDVILWANKVRLNASVDTRVHLNHSVIDYFQPGFTEQSGRVFVSAGQNLQPFATYLKSFREWYTHCSDCVQTPAGNWIPQAPSGLTPAYTHYFGGSPQDDMRSGFAPADDETDFAALRSGNVYIVASEVEFGPQITPAAGQEPPGCSGSTVLKRFGIQVGGVRGGRGGAGTPSYYIGPGNALQTSVSGDTGPGGRGGDAGDITVIRVNSPWTLPEKQRIQEVMHAAGGRAGDARRLKAPTWNDPLPPTGSYCDFLRAPQGTWPRSPDGRPGSVTIRSLSSTDATAFVGQLIKAKDSRFDYDLSLLAERAENDLSITQLNFDDFLVTTLAAALGRAESRAASDLQSIVVDGRLPQRPLVEEYLIGLELNSALAANLSNRSRVFGRQLSLFAAPSDAFVSYLASSGGLLNVASKTPFNRFISESTRLDLAAQTTALQDLKGQLVGIGTILAEFDIRQERQQRLNAIAALQARIAIAISEAQAQSALSWAGDLGQALGAAGTSGTALYAAYQSGVPSAVLTSGGKFLSDLDKVRAIWSANSEGVSGIEALRHELERLQEEYLQFVSRVAETRQRNSDSRIQALASVLGARSAQGSRRETRHAQFQDLFRLTFISHLTDPPRDVGTFINNLDGLRVFLTVFPASEPYFQFRDFELTCKLRSRWFTTIADADCARVKSSNLSQGVFVDWALQTGSARLPLYLVAPQVKDLWLPTFGLRFEIVDLPTPTVGTTSQASEKGAVFK